MSFSSHSTHGPLTIVSIVASYIAVHSQGILQGTAWFVSVMAGLVSIAYTVHKWRKEK